MIDKQIMQRRFSKNAASYTKDGEIIYQEQRPYMSKTKPIPWIDIFEHWRLKQGLSATQHILNPFRNLFKRI